MDRDSESLIRSNLTRCREAMAAAARSSGRSPGEIRLVAVTKYVDADAIRQLHAAGVRDFGESRVQRAVALAEELRDLDGVRWHLVGHLQRNKVRRALATFTTIHSVDSVRLARELVTRADDASGLPELFVEANVSGESRKTGASEEELDAILDVLRGEARVRVAGLMGMSSRVEDPGAARRAFQRLRRLRDERVLSGRLSPGAGLSMGMSADFEVAIQEGATVVRVGTLLFEGLPSG